MDLVLIVDGRPIDVPVEVATSRAARRRGLLVRAAPVGALVLRPCRQVHTIGMRVTIDVAFCAADGAVVRTTTLPPGRVSWPSRRARFVIEAPTGAFAAWGIRRGARVSVRACGREP